MTPPRLVSADGLPAAVRRPAYDPAQHGIGIVHLGLGAFHRAHQAVYTDDALADAGGDWRIAGVSLRSTGIADALNPQNGLYTVLERGAAGTGVRVIGSVAKVIAARRGADAVLAAMTDPATRIVSLTVTEKAYGIDRVSREIDADHPAVAADLTTPREPEGVLGLLVEALRLRHAAGVAPFTVVCCDNLPENGRLLRAGTLAFAGRSAPDLVAWLRDEVAFPSTMVDRIAPAVTERTLADTARLTGRTDLAAVDTEPFSQWVVEDRFTAGRPAWEAGGALFVADVAPYERMKLRMINGPHSMMGYAGFLSGCTHVRDVMAHPHLPALIERHMAAAALTLSPLPGIDFADYGRQVRSRFANPEIAHETYQIAMDGTEKLPQRIPAPALEALRAGTPFEPFAFAAAVWMRYCLGVTDSGQRYALRDPREDAIGAAVCRAGRNADALFDGLSALAGVFPAELVAMPAWRDAVRQRLAAILDKGVARAIADEAGV